MNIKDKLLKNLIVNKNQGYALYFEHENDIIECYNGVENLETLKPINENSNFRLASVSKQFIAHGIVNLINKDKLKYDTKLKNIFSKLPLYMQNIQIINLLNHTSGIPDFEDMQSESQILDIDVLEYVKKQNQGYFTPGKEYCYSNSGYVLLGLVIEKISGKNVEDYIKENVLEKFGMSNSILNRQGITNIVNRVYGTKLTDEYAIYDQGRETATIGDGGVYSSIHDLKIYLNYFINLDLEKTYNPKVLISNDNWYSKGIRIAKENNHTIYYHNGETLGTNTSIGVIPDLKIKFIFLTNLDGIDTALFIDNIKEYIASM